MSNEINDFWDDVKDIKKNHRSLLIKKGDMMSNSTFNSTKTKERTINQPFNTTKKKSPFLSRLTRKEGKNTKSLYNIKLKNSSKIKSKNAKIINYNRNNDKINIKNKKQVSSNSSYFKENKKINRTINKSNKSLEKTVSLNHKESKKIISKNKVRKKSINEKDKKSPHNSQKASKKDSLYKNYNEIKDKMACTFRPIVHECPKFKKVTYNNNEYLSLLYFNKRMDSARKEKRFKSRIKPFEEINYDEIYQNISDRCSCLNRNRSGSNNRGVNNIMQKSLSQTEFILCKNNLHSTLMKIKLKK